MAQAPDRGAVASGQSRHEAGGFGTYHALLIAMPNYPDGSGWGDLPTTRLEVAELETVLTSRFQFDTADVTTLVNPTRAEVLEALSALAERLGPDDNLLIYYSGHGYYDSLRVEGYWPLADAKRSRTSWLSNSDMVTELRALRARQVLVIADACFAGALATARGQEDRPAFRNQTAVQFASRRSRRVLAAGTKAQRVPARSVFAAELLTQLRTAEDEAIPAQRLYSGVLDRVVAGTSGATTPVFERIPELDDEQGDFVFVRRGGPAPTPRPTVSTAVPTTGEALRSDGDRALREGRTTDAMTLFQRACDDGHAPACTAAGQLAELIPEKLIQARALYAKACDGGDGEGCAAEAYLYLNGLGGDPSPGRARVLYQRGCYLSNAGSCRNLAYLFLSENSIALDRIQQERDAARTRCNEGDALACTVIGTLLEFGLGGAADRPGAVVAYDLGCRGGVQQACEGGQRLRAPRP